MKKSVLAALVFVQAAAAPLLAEGDDRYDPDWADVAPLATIVHTYDDTASEQQNGAALKSAVQNLQPGDRLLVEGGVYSVNSLFSVSLVGTAAAPIRIEAMPGETPVLTRPNAGQNCINIGTPSSGPTRFLLIRGLEITGGSIGVRVEDCEDLWIDECYVHHTGAVTLRASSHDTARLTITDSEFAFSSVSNDTGEGIYLGANNGVVITHGTVVARNYVHDMYTDQGDGIELKQGSYDCLIAENVVHSTNFPGILVYGTDGEALNVVERNLVYDITQNAMQVQGEAIVRNNVVFGGDRPAFLSFDHQGTTIDLTVANNTFVTTSGRAARLNSWNGRAGMELVNNALYSESGDAIFAVGGLAGVTIEGNVVHGNVVDFGAGMYAQGSGLADFADASWDGTLRDVHPSPGGALIEAGSSALGAEEDGAGATRPGAGGAAGAFEPGTYGCFGGEPLMGAAGEPLIRVDRLPEFGGPDPVLSLIGAAPSQTAVLFFYLVSDTGSTNPYAVRRFTATGGAGNAQLTLDLPVDPVFQGLTFEAVWAARDSLGPDFFSLTQAVRWTL